MMPNIRECDQNVIRLYTLNEAEEIISRRRMYFLKQKSCGILMMVIGIICPIVFNGDATFSLIAVPIGIGLLVTRQKVMSFET